MRFSLSNQFSPIAVDFGSSGVKLMQISGGESPQLIATAELEIPDEIRGDVEKRFAFLSDELPAAIRKGGFKGKRVVISPLASQVFAQHMQLERVEGLDDLEQIKTKLQMQLNCVPDNLVVRHHKVADLTRAGRAVSETLCFAMARDDAMRYVDLFKRSRFQVAGIHNQVQALTRAFSHLYRRTEDAMAVSMYVDMGWGSAKVAITHGADLVFAKCIQIGGRHFDRLVGEAMKCDVRTARARRLTDDLIGSSAPKSAARDRTVEAGGLAMLRAGMLKSADAARESSEGRVSTVSDRRNNGAPAEFAVPIRSESNGPAAVGKVDFSELVESVSDELSACLRYHGAVFPGRGVDRVVFLGGESRSVGLCRHLAEGIGIEAQLGDPISRYAANGADDSNLPDPGNASPGWAVATGLCVSPCDL